jgi:hypothetical protein
MASEVKRKNLPAEAARSLPKRDPRNKRSRAGRLHRRVSLLTSATRLRPTTLGVEGTRPLAPAGVTAGTRLRAPDTRAFPVPADLSGEFAPASGRSRFGAGSARGQPRGLIPAVPLFHRQSRGRVGGLSNRRGREQGRSQTQRLLGGPTSCCSGSAFVPGCLSSDAQLPDTPGYALCWSMASAFSITGEASRPRRRHGTGWPSRSYNWSTAGYSRWPVACAHRSRALPDAPQRKHCHTPRPRCAEKDRLRGEVAPCSGHAPRT